jgi:hypothetical protein
MLHSQTKEVIWNIHTLMKQDTKHQTTINLHQIQKCVSTATGMSVRALQRIQQAAQSTASEEHTLSPPPCS